MYGRATLFLSSSPPESLVHLTLSDNGGGQVRSNSCSSSCQARASTQHSRSPRQRRATRLDGHSGPWLTETSSSSGAAARIMESVLICLAITALAEVGDKTQLLALILAARLKQPRAIIAGIVIATLTNHALASALGAWIATVMSPPTLHNLLGLSFLGLAIWTVTADDSRPRVIKRGRQVGVFWVSVISFFFAEIGDKTQLATLVLAGRYGSPVSTVLSTTVGVLLVDVPTVLIGCMTRGIPVRLLQTGAAAILVLLGITSFIAAAGWRLE
jgi:Ca2+/H+ antiporter, TMEM165/GDT1 family